MQKIRVPAKIQRRRKPPLRWYPRKSALKTRVTLTSVYRLAVQFGFVLLCLFIGWRFNKFVQAASETVSGDLPYRPPGVEGFLPISGLMGAVDWVHQGVLNNIHPAATVLLLVFLVISIMLRKAFCGWICPVGFISENLARVGQLLFKRNSRLWYPVDVLLRGIKYFILGFFVFAIFGMSPDQLHGFIESPYNRVSDIKMMGFFTGVSQLAAIILSTLAVLSILVHSFWCRYMCPYGALMGLVSWISPVKVRRIDDVCTDCKICDRVCPARIDISRIETVHNPECIGCGDCVTSCPVPGAIEIGTKDQKLKPINLAMAVVILFTAGYITAQLAGIWQNEIPSDEVRYHIIHMDEPDYAHPR